MTKHSFAKLTIRTDTENRMAKDEIPIIDLFAGPGGLGEGFSAFSPGGSGGLRRPFRISLSIEQDRNAHQTLLLRAFYRSLERDGAVPEFYYEIIRQGVRSDLRQLVEESGDAKLLHSLREAEREAVRLTLGTSNRREVSRLIANAVGENDNWVLVGGPPCQAYSLVGRSRNRGKEGYRIEEDHRSHLYKEYLRVIAEGLPAVFVMENVKGMLSARLDGKPVFQKILSDLSAPGRAVRGSTRRSRATGYRIIPAVTDLAAGNPSDCGQNGAGLEPGDFIVRCEDHGIPQLRHRVILLGLRDDLPGLEGFLLDHSLRLFPDRSICPSVLEMIGGLPKLASGLSSLWRHGKRVRAKEAASDFLRRACKGGFEDPDWGWMESYGSDGPDKARIVRRIRLAAARAAAHGSGGEFVKTGAGNYVPVHHLAGWLLDYRLGGVANHSGRSHLGCDLVRYVFSAAFAEQHGRSPQLDDFPPELMPRHRSAGTGHFNDRFRVQIGQCPATTVTSHISRDGHYFIHPDPEQCRSLTVREAARIQTFPDNYFFCGPRTSQFTQVGNAVPPYLALQLAGTVWNFLERAVGP